MGNRPQTHLEDLFQEILMVHTVPVKQEKELVNLSRQQKFIHKRGYAGTKWWQSNSQGLQAELRAALEENPMEELNSGHRYKTS